MSLQFVLASVLLLAAGLANGKIYFQDRFDSGNLDSWVSSTHRGSEAGSFILSSGKFFGDEKKDIGIQTSEDARFYGLSANFPSFSIGKKPFVVQFTVKHEQNIDCGGGYIKVFDSSLDQKDMHGDSPYAIMFGPDICGPGTKKVHVIFNYKGKNHLISKDIRCKDDVFSHLYTLVLDPNAGDYKVLIDNEQVESGTLSDDWDFLPPKKINDPEATKPEDWDERPKIDDAEDSKPADWDQAEHIPDPEATKPEDWDDEMDGEWEPAMIDNPDFKGEWTPRQIDNPDYKGKWVHPEIDNPEYNADEVKDLGKFKDISNVGFDLWQVKSGTIFDNILITDDVEEAKKIGEETWGATKDPEKAMKDAQDEEEKKKADEDTRNSAEEVEDEDEDDEDLDDMDEDDKSHDEL